MRLGARLAFLAFGACRGPAVPGLEAPDALVVYALQPGREPEGATPAFHGQAVTKSVEIKDPGRRAAIVTAVDGAIREGGRQAKCFNPRHGLRATKAGVVRDLVICFECHNVSIEGEDQMRAISDSAAATLDEALARP